MTAYQPVPKQLACPFNKPGTKLDDCKQLLKERPNIPFLQEGNVQIRMFQGKLLCNGYDCKHNKYTGLMYECAKTDVKL